MMKSTSIALVVALATFAAPAAMAHPHSAAHSHLTRSHVSTTVREPGYARTEPAGPNWGSECVTDEGQGRFFPCDSGPQCGASGWCPHGPGSSRLIRQRLELFDGLMDRSIASHVA